MECLLFHFLLSRMFPWMNKFLFTENNFLTSLIKKENYSSSRCIFQIVSTLNAYSINTHRILCNILIGCMFLSCHVDSNPQPLS